MKQSKLLNNVQKLKLPMLLFCALSVTACAHNSPKPPAALPTLPPPPSLSTPLPSVDYSLTAARNIRAWQQTLQATQLMSAPTAKPGQ